jgi:hypothetical protein
MTGLVHRGRRDEAELEALRLRAGDLERDLTVRADQVDRLKGELDVFKAHYRQQVGTLYQQLDALEVAIAEAELGELSAEVGEAPPDADAGAPPRASEAPRFTSDAIRRLFRDVAKAIHPDLSEDEAARHRRHALMAEANRAYADGDAEQLRMILDAWTRSPEAVRGSDPVAIRLRLTRRVSELEERLAALDAELVALQASPLCELKSKVDEAAAKGRDLIGELVKRLQRDVMVARNRLDAMRS